MMKTKFDKNKLYELLTKIPRGNVITYGRAAEMLGNKSWARAVGNALHKNPDGEKYPCYKVVNAKGELSESYAFGGIDEQKRRLLSDGITVENNKVDLQKYGY
ncbi:MAG: MGMT family protein [Eubacteriales bacterium]